MIDSLMPQANDRQRIVAGQRVTINHGAGHNPFFLDGQQRGRLGAGDDHGIGLAALF